MSSVPVQAIKNLVKGVPGVKPVSTKSKRRTFAEIDKAHTPKPVKEKLVKAAKTKKTASPKPPREPKQPTKSKQFTEIAYTPKTPPVDLRGFENN
jgi:hypothetical protein